MPTFPEPSWLADAAINVFVWGWALVMTLAVATQIAFFLTDRKWAGPATLVSAFVALVMFGACFALGPTS